VRALHSPIDDVQVQGGRVFCEFHQVEHPLVAPGAEQHVDDGDTGHHAARARGTRRHCCRVESTEVTLERDDGAIGEIDGDAFVVDERQPGRAGGHHADDSGLGAHRVGSDRRQPTITPVVRSIAVRAVTILPDGRLEIDERPDPTPGPGEALVRVHGAGLNRADLLQRAGHYPPPPGFPPDIPGLEFAGEVAAVGTDVDALVPGDRVFGIAAAAAQAEYVVVPARQCARVPLELDLVHAGGIPEAFITAFDALTTANFIAGEHVLVHAVGSGVGTAAVQLVHAFGGVVTGTARTATKLTEARALGLDHGVLVPTVFDPRELAQEIVEQGGPVDVVLDLVGGPYVSTDLAAVATKGRIVVVGLMAGAKLELPLRTLMDRRASLIGTVLRARSPEEKEAITREFARRVVPLFAELRLRPIVDRVFPLTEVEDAYALLASDAVFGKVILDLR